MLRRMSGSPSETELEAMAERLVAEATEGYEIHLTAAAMRVVRESLVNELLCTSYGRARLYACLTGSPLEPDQSDDHVIDPALQKLLRKKTGRLA